MKHLLSNFEHWTIFALLVALNLLDAVLTAILVEKYGSSVEFNPVIRYAIDLHGIPGLYMIKLVVLGFLGLIVMNIVRYYTEHRIAANVKKYMWILCALLGLIVVNNTVLVIVAINT